MTGGLDFFAIMRESASRPPTVSSNPSELDYHDVRQVTERVSNRLQEIMNLVYLLARSVEVPSDVRHHVTQAQAELACLSKVFNNRVRTAVLDRDRRDEKASAAGI